MKRSALLLLIIAAVLSLSACKTKQYGASWDGLPREQKQGQLFAGDFQVSTSVAAIPPGLQDEFRRATKQRQFQLADPSADGEAARKLILWGASPEKSFIEYEHGDDINVLVFARQDDKYNFKWGGRSNAPASDLSQLRQMVAAGNFKDDQPYWW